MARSQLCKDCYWFMSAINVIMEGEPLSDKGSSNRSNSRNGSNMIYEVNLRKYLRMLPNSYEFLDVSKKFKYIAMDWLTLYDHKQALETLAVSVVEKLMSNEQD